MNRMPIAILLIAGAAVAPVWADTSPVGLWKTIDDETKTEKSLVRIKEVDGALQGSIEKILDPAKAGSVCEKCTDERKDKPVVGLTIIRQVKQSAEDKSVWDSGEILDPNNGKVYRTRLKPADGGKKLEVRGYIGPFYRTQVWLRAE